MGSRFPSPLGSMRSSGCSCRTPGTVFSPKRIYRTVWGEEPFGVENAVAVHIRHLREKLEINPSDPRYIKVVWGQGYKMEGGKL